MWDRGIQKRAKPSGFVLQISTVRIPVPGIPTVSIPRLVLTTRRLLSHLPLLPQVVHGAPTHRQQEDAQASFTIDPSQIHPGLAQDGQPAVALDGQVRSLTSTNNLYVCFSSLRYWHFKNVCFDSRQRH